MAPRSCDVRRLTLWQRALLSALLMGAPGIPSATAHAASAAQSPVTVRPGAAAATEMTRFSELTELTPANVQGLMPLVARKNTSALEDQDHALAQNGPAPGLQVDSSAAIDLRLQRFVAERAGQIQ